MGDAGKKNPECSIQNEVSGVWEAPQCADSGTTARLHERTNARSRAEPASGCGNLTTEPKTMEPEEIKRLTRKALCETPGKEAEVSLVVQQDSLWFILLRSGEEEWAVKVKETAQSTDESIQQDLESEIRKLF